jgi:hypothetical protein
MFFIGIVVGKRLIGQYESISPQKNQFQVIGYIV